MDIDEIEPHTREIQAAIEEMYAKLPTETRILEGTSIEPYAIRLSSLENELSRPKLSEEQWKTACANGSWTTVPTHIFEGDLNSSCCFAKRSNLGSVIDASGNKCPQMPSDCLPEMLESCGQETDATNECSECTVPMTSELTLGMPNEQR